jgi:hypothetical protein
MLVRSETIYVNLLKTVISKISKIKHLWDLNKLIQIFLKFNNKQKILTIK